MKQDICHVASQKYLSRRTFLGGAGACVGLPLLEAMLPIGKNAFAAGDQPSRFLAYYVPNGIHMASWTPAETGSTYTLSETLAALNNVKDDLLVLSNLGNRPAIPPGNGAHASGTGSFLTATSVRKTEGSDIQNGISVDQAAAQVIGTQTRLASLELGMDGGGSTGGCDSGYSCAYARNIAWSGPRTPVPKITDPRLVYDRIFAGMDTNLSDAEREKRRRQNQSVLDYVLADIQKLQQKVSQNDRAKLDEYFTSIENLERNITSAENELACTAPDRPSGSYDFTEKATLMADLMVLAFQCDITRIQTFMLGNAASERRYDFLGISEGHHTISHHQSLQSNYEKLKTINAWEIQQFSYLLEQMKATTSVDGSNLLECSSVYFSSEISDGDRHNHWDLPVILAGGSNGYFKTGEHINFATEQPVANLFLAILDALGAPRESFGDDSTGILTEVTQA